MRDAFETVSVGVIRYLSNQSLPVVTQEQDAFANFDFSSLFPLPATTVEQGSEEHGDVDLGVADLSDVELGVAVPNDVEPDDADPSEADSDERSKDSQPGMSVPVAMHAIDKFFSNPFLELGAVGNLDFNLETCIRPIAK